MISIGSLLFLYYCEVKNKTIHEGTSHNHILSPSKTLCHGCSSIQLVISKVIGIHASCEVQVL